MSVTKSRLGAIADAVRSALRSTIDAAGSYVVRPAAEAAGVARPEPPPATKSSRKAARKRAVAAAVESGAAQVPLTGTKSSVLAAGAASETAMRKAARRAGKPARDRSEAEGAVPVRGGPRP